MTRPHVIPDADRLHRALVDHETWFSTGGRAGYRADLSNCDLRGFDLSGYTLDGAYRDNTLFPEITQ